MVEKTQENTTFVINENKRASSYEVGKAGARWKLYFEDATDLKFQVQSLKEAGFLVDDEV